MRLSLIVFVAFFLAVTLAVRAENGISEKLAAPAMNALIKQKLQAITLPAVKFENLEVASAIETLNTMAKAQDPDQLGVKIIYHPPPGGSAPIHNLITLQLDNVPLGDALGYVVKLAGLQYKIESGQVVVFAP